MLTPELKSGALCEMSLHRIYIIIIITRLKKAVITKMEAQNLNKFEENHEKQNFKFYQLVIRLVLAFGLSKFG